MTGDLSTAEKERKAERQKVRRAEKKAALEEQRAAEAAALHRAEHIARRKEINRKYYLKQQAHNTMPDSKPTPSTPCGVARAGGRTTPTTPGKRSAPTTPAKRPAQAPLQTPDGAIIHAFERHSAAHQSSRKF
jgi:hypothetical protein